MEQARIIYETLVGDRVCDVHWWRVKKAMTACELNMNKAGFELFLALKNVSPRYFAQYHKVKRQVANLEPSVGEGVTGEQFVHLLKRLNIEPNQSTISRWFKSCGGFKAKAFYNKTVLIPIIAIALIYKAKNQNNQLAKVG
ncbi:hypothetical protein BCD64_00150 [Nostoc sp. MBR 210]|nr:hypothetical protein BCD64_00150 [Nostoc sp. MBR 210]